jgi:hypothetical protein
MLEVVEKKEGNNREFDTITRAARVLGKRVIFRVADVKTKRV